MASAARTLTILRHAKAANGEPQGDDHARALTPKGRQAAQRLGEALASKRFEVERVLSSTSQRTRETVECLEAGLGRALPVEYTPKLYLSSPAEMLGLLQALPDSVESVMLVGHNPGMHQFCLDMAARGSEALLEELHMGFPTCALARITLAPGPWKTLAMRSGTLQELWTRALIEEKV